MALTSKISSASRLSGNSRLFINRCMSFASHDGDDNGFGGGGYGHGGRGGGRGSYGGRGGYRDGGQGGRDFYPPRGGGGGYSDGGYNSGPPQRGGRFQDFGSGPGRRYGAGNIDGGYGQGFGQGGSSYRHQYHPRRDHRAQEDLPLPEQGPFTLFMGNLDYNVTDEDITGFFDGLEVEGISTPQNEFGLKRGFGFVTFANRADAQHALENHNEKTLLTRRVFMKVAHPRREDRPAASGRGHSDSFSTPSQGAADSFDGSKNFEDKDMDFGEDPLGHEDDDKKSY